MSWGCDLGMSLKPTALLSLVVPVALAGLVILLFRDPTYRFPLLAFSLPFFLRGAAAAVGLYDRRTRPSVTARVFSTLGFAGFMVGWLLTFAVVGFVVAMAVFSREPSGDLLKLLLFIAAGELMVAAWFIWPWYAREVLSNWARQGVRIWTSSGNRWDRLSMAWRLQQMTDSGGIRWRGFGATALVVASLMVLAAVGASDSVVARTTEVVVLLLLPPLHMTIVREANALCNRWAERVSER